MLLLQGNVVVQKDDNSSDFEARHTFIVSHGNDGRWLQFNDGATTPSISFEAVSRPGHFLTRPVSGIRAMNNKDCQDSLPDSQCALLMMESSPLPDPFNPCRNKAGEWVVADFGSLLCLCLSYAIWDELSIRESKWHVTQAFWWHHAGGLARSAMFWTSRRQSSRAHQTQHLHMRNPSGHIRRLAHTFRTASS